MGRFVAALAVLLYVSTQAWAQAPDVRAFATSLGMPNDLQSILAMTQTLQNVANHLGGELETLETSVQQQLAADEAQRATLIEWLQASEAEKAALIEQLKRAQSQATAR